MENTVKFLLYFNVLSEIYIIFLQILIKSRILALHVELLSCPPAGEWPDSYIRCLSILFADEKEAKRKTQEKNSLSVNGNDDESPILNGTKDLLTLLDGWFVSLELHLLWQKVESPAP